MLRPIGHDRDQPRRVIATSGEGAPRAAAVLPPLSLGAMRADLADALEPRVSRLGYLGEFFQYTAHQPDALLAFLQFTEEAKKSLDERIVELIALTVASVTDNAYERNQHERLAIRLGLGRSWVESVVALSPSRLTARDEQIVQAFLLASVPTLGRAGCQEFTGVVDELGPQGAVAVLLVSGRYLVHALVVNTLGLAAPVPSIFEDGFDGG